MGPSGPEGSSENEHGWEVVENIDADEPSATAKNTIYRWVDTEAGVVLYYFTGAEKGGLTAVPLSETDLASGEE